MQEEKVEKFRPVVELAIAVIVALCVSFLSGDPGANAARSAIVAAIGAGASLAVVLVWRSYRKRIAKENSHSA